MPGGSQKEDGAPVIGGLACRFPQSPSTSAFWDNLVSGVNMVTADDEHFPSGFHGQLPMGKGSVSNQQHFDNFFFGMSGAQAEKTDPQLRFLLELSYEALVDSNLDLQRVKGSNCGVFVGSCFSDAHKGWLGNAKEITGYENTGCAQSMYANRLSFFYDLHGPSLNLDTACSSALVAFAQACRALDSGECDICLVGGSSITLHPGVSVAFNQLHMLSKDSACMSFSKHGNGYARAEGVAMLVLYKEDKVHKYLKKALSPSAPPPPPTAYFKVRGSGVNSDGFTAKGITFPNGDAQYLLYKQVCDRAGVAADDVFYIEAHGTGTAAGDAQELEALRKAYAAPRSEGSDALLIGSVKSNMGHAEGASAMAGLVKLCLSFQEQLIPADLHYTYDIRNPSCEPMLGDRSVCKVVETNTAIEQPGNRVCAISSFGFGGTNAHAVLESAEKVAEMAAAAPASAGGENADSCGEEQWLNICPVYGRTEDGVRACLEKILAGEKADVKPEEKTNYRFKELAGVPCVHDHKKEFPACGFATTAGELFSAEEGTDYVKQQPLYENSTASAHGARPVWLLFSGNGGMWPLMGKDLYLNSPIYKKTYDRCAMHLETQHNCRSLTKFLEDPDIKNYNGVDGVCGLAAIQISLCELLKHMQVEVCGMVGHSAGEAAMGFMDGCLTLEEVMSVAYYRSLCGADSVDAENPGGMYACGVSRAEAEELLKKYNCTGMTQVGCDNDPGMVTLSGSEKEMRPITVELTAKKVLCRKVPTFGVAFHSKMLEPGLQNLRGQLESVIDDVKDSLPRRRSPKWISTCYDPDELRADPEHAGNFISAEYHCFNFRNTVEFHRAVSKNIPTDAVIVEVGPSGLFRSSIKKIAAATGKKYEYLSMMARDKNTFHTLQECYGQLFFKGCVPALKLDLEAGPRGLREMPFGRDLAIRQSFVQWDHSSEYALPQLKDMMSRTGAEGEELGAAGGGDWRNVHLVDFDFAADRDAFILGHVIDKTVLMPACGYVYAAWEGFASVCRKRAPSPAEAAEVRVDDVVLGDFRIHQGIRLDESNRQLQLTTKFKPQNPANGENLFEIFYGEEHIVTGKIRLAKGPELEGSTCASSKEGDMSPSFGHALGSISANEFYNRIARNGYNYQDEFQLVESVAVDDKWAWVKFPKAGDMMRDDFDEAAPAEAGGTKKTSNVAETGSLAHQAPTAALDERARECILNRHWISYLDNLLQVGLLKDLHDSETLRVPTVIREISIRGSKFAELLKKMRDGSAGMRNIDSCDTVASDTDAKSWAGHDQAQLQSGTQLVKMLPYMNKITSEIADVTGLATSIMARSTKEKEKRITHAAKKKNIAFFSGSSASDGETPSTSPAQQSYHEVDDAKTAVGIVVAYLKEQFVSGNFTVCDYKPCGVDVASQAFVEVSNVERFSTVFGADLSEEKKSEYAGRFDGLFEEADEKALMKPGGADAVRANVLIAHGNVLSATRTQLSEMAEMARQGVTMAVDNLVISENDKVVAEEKQPGFVLFSEPTGMQIGTKTDFAKLGLSSPLFVIRAADVMRDFVLCRKKADDEEALKSGSSAQADVETDGMSSQLLPFADIEVGAGGATELSPFCASTTKIAFLRLSEEVFEGEGIVMLSELLSAKFSSEKAPNLQKLFVLSRAPGFPGFLKCLQREPGFGRVRGVHLVSGDADPRVLPALGACNERVTDLKKAIVDLDARLAVLNVAGRTVGTSLSVELPYYDANELVRKHVGSSFPAPFGRFLTFPQPGNLEAYKWKAHAHPSVLLAAERPAGATTTNRAGAAGSNVNKAAAKIKLPAGSTPLPLDSGAGVEMFIPQPEEKSMGDPAARKHKYMAFHYGDESSEERGAGGSGAGSAVGSLLGSLFGSGKIESKASQASPVDSGVDTAAQIREQLQANNAAARLKLTAEDVLPWRLRQHYYSGSSTGTAASCAGGNDEKHAVPRIDVDVAYSALNFRDVMLAYNKIDKDALVGHSKMGDGFGLEFAGYCADASSGAAAADDFVHDIWYGRPQANVGGPGKRSAKRVVGLTYNSIATRVSVPRNLVWELKPDQDLREYATVPCVYATCYYSLLVRGYFDATTSVLIHAGAGGVGQAALYICLRRTQNPNLVFTTCSAGKRKYLMQKFGHLGLQEGNIGNSRDCSFEDLVMAKTDGRGVDIVLNSLSDEKLMASVRCVAEFGRFCEIGKYDLMQNTGLGMHCLLKNVSVMGIDLDQLLNMPKEWARVYALVTEGLNSGEVVPLDVSGEYADTQITEAFRFMAAGTHVGKVLIKFHSKNAPGTAAVAGSGNKNDVSSEDAAGAPPSGTSGADAALRARPQNYVEEGEAQKSMGGTGVTPSTRDGTEAPTPIDSEPIGASVGAPGSVATARSATLELLASSGVTTAEMLDLMQADVPVFAPRNPETDAYLIVGGLGGFGLELAKFLAKRGVKKLILSSRGRVRSGLQAKCLAEVTKQYGCSVTVTKLDFTDLNTVRKFLKHTKIAGFFNLGMVLADGLFQRMQPQQWATPAQAKGVVSDNFSVALQEMQSTKTGGRPSPGGAAAGAAGAGASAPADLDHFVVFSSVSAGLGNAGQTNYGFANSQLDALVRSRNARGKPGLSVQWGAIGDVGVLSRAASKKTGLVDAILPQDIQSCLAELEKLLALNETGVHTVFVTPRRVKDDGASAGDDSVPLADKVLDIIGAKSAKDTATLEQLGVDSLQSMEIQSMIKIRTGEKVPMEKLSKMTIKALRDMEA